VNLEVMALLAALTLSGFEFLAFNREALEKAGRLYAGGWDFLRRLWR